jgi:hypothetical protein
MQVGLAAGGRVEYLRAVGRVQAADRGAAVVIADRRSTSEQLQSGGVTPLVAGREMGGVVDLGVHQTHVSVQVFP